MLRQLAALCCVVLAVGAVQAQQDAVGHYTIVGSKQIRPHSDYHIAVNLHDATEANSVRLTIQNAGDFKLVKEVVVQPHSTESVAFELGDIPLGGGDIKLVAEGLTGIRFRNETELVVSVKRFSVLVQTDKAMYKPGDLVRFRVLILDPNTKPLDVNGGLQVHMKDGGGNRIKQWSNETAHRGVFTGELQLSDYPVLGQWTLVVEVMGETKKKTLEVAEYVLPKFEVLIETEKDVLYKDGKISANIRGKYTYGKPVRGEATVTLQPKIRGGYQPLAGDLISHKVISKIVTKGSVEFGISEDLKLNEEYERELQMDVIFEEELTGRTQTAQTFIKIRRSHYKIAKVGGRFTYKDGEPFALELQVTRHDGRPVVDTSSPIEVSYSADQVYSADETHSETGRLDKHGRANFVLNFPANKSGFNIKAKYMDLTEGLGYVSKYSFMASQVRGLQTKVLTEKPTLGKPIIVEVESETPLDSFTYQIFGRGDIIKTETVSVSGVQRYEIKFLASFAMVPTVKIVVYHIKDGQMHSSTESITLRDSLQNTITLEPSTFETQPGKNVDLTITTRPNSYVGLLGVDQSVLLLKSGNDLTQSEVFDELDEYTKSSENANLRRFSPYGMYGSHGQSSASFDNVGAFLISNLYEPIPVYPHLRRTIGLAPNGIAFRAHAAIPMTTKSAQSATLPVIRKDFPESWIWEDTLVSDSPDGVHTLHKKVPDTITSWVITAFALDPVTGLALTAEPTKLKVFQPFFVSLNLPYSIKRGEVVSIPIVVFNYMESAVNAEVTLHNEDQDFEFVEISNEVEEVTPKIELFRRKRIAIKSNDGTATSFMIKPTKTGPLTIKVTATSPLAGDGVERILPVEPEGVPVYNNKAVFVDLRDTTQLTTNFTIEVPKNAVPDSTRIEVSIIGDVLGPTIQNLESLIRMPYGCGEQNMLHFVPNIVVLNYLKNTQQLNAAIEAKAKKFMEIGYQRELTYRHQDGSFSAFGQSDSSGSTWLTAFVARSFRQAADHVTVEEKIIDQALQFLAGVQADNGSFPEVGTVVHADMQGGSGQGIALTAYTLIAFLENRPAAVEKYRNVINKAMDYIVRNLEQLTDEVYAQALAAYALQLAQHNAKDYVLNTLDGHANRTGGLMFWTKPVPESERGSVWYDRPNSVNTEMTAYALLAHIEAGPYTTAIPIMKWLLAQRNAEGGFESTQDTVIGLQALAKVAEKIANTDSDMRLAVRYGEGQTRDMQLNGGNRMVMQQFVLPSGTRTVNVTASGHGFGLLSLSYQYNVNVTGAWPRFTVDPQVNRNSNADYLHLTVCTSFIPTNDTKVSNMAVMEVEFPSGFTADLDTIPSLEATENVKKVETKNGDTVIVIYFDNLSVKELCPTVDAFRTHKVAMQKPAAVTVYDYYDTARKARMFYKIPASGLCDICEEECPDSCKAQAAEQRAERPSMDGFQSGSAGRIAAQTMSALLMIVVAAMW